MGWTTPRSWANGDVPSGADLNTHLRDNTKYLKDVLDGNEQQDIIWRKASADTNGSSVFHRKSRGSIGTPTIVLASDFTGFIRFQGWDGTQWVSTAAISSLVDGTPGANDMPGALLFYTTPDGGASGVERLRLTAAGKILTTAIGEFTALTANDVSLTVFSKQSPTVNTFAVRRDLGGGSFSTDFAVNQNGRCVFGVVSGGALGALGGKIEVSISGVTKYVPYYDS